MMKQSKSIYQNGFFVLKNNITRTVAVTLCLVSIVLLCYLAQNLTFLFFGLEIWHPSHALDSGRVTGIVSAGWILFAFFVLFPFMTGVKKWFYASCREADNDFTIIFDFFSAPSLYLKALSFGFHVIGRKVLWYAVCLLPASGVQLLNHYLASGGSGTAGVLSGTLDVLFNIMVVAGLFAAFYYNLRYYLVYYIWFENPEISRKEAMNRSVGKMGTKRKNVLKVYFSLVPFLLACILVVPVLALLPAYYILTSLQGRRLLQE